MTKQIIYRVTLKANGQVYQTDDYALETAAQNRAAWWKSTSNKYERHSASVKKQIMWKA